MFSRLPGTKQLLGVVSAYGAPWGGLSRRLHAPCLGNLRAVGVMEVSEQGGLTGIPF